MKSKKPIVKIAKDRIELEQIRKDNKDKFIFYPSAPGDKVKFPVKVSIH